VYDSAVKIDPTPPFPIKGRRRKALENIYECGFF